MMLAASQPHHRWPGLSAGMLPSDLLARPGPTGWTLLAAKPLQQLSGRAVQRIFSLPGSPQKEADFVKLSFKILPCLAAVLVLDGCPAALRVAPAWLRDDPPGRLAASLPIALPAIEGRITFAHRWESLHTANQLSLSENVEL